MVAAPQAVGRSILMRRKKRKDETGWKARIAAPFDFGATAASGLSANTLTAPSRGRLAFSHGGGLAAGAAIVHAGARVFTCPALAADQVHRGNWVERGQLVRLERSGAAAAGTLTVYVVDAYGRHRAIGTSAFS